MKIKLIELETLHKSANGDYELDFYPDREFDSEIFICPNHKEFWSTIFPFIYYFILNDKKNIKVTAVHRINFLPILPFFAHKLILLNDSSIIDDYSMYDRTNIIKKKYNITKLKTYYVPDDSIEMVKVHYLEKMKTLYILKQAHDLLRQKDFVDNGFFIFGTKNVYRYNDKFMNFLDHVSHTFPVIHGDEFINEFFGCMEFKESLLSLQILLSLCKNWTFSGIGGSANLFMSLPVSRFFIMESFDVEKNKSNNLFSDHVISKHINSIIFGKEVKTFHYTNIRFKFYRTLFRNYIEYLEEIDYIHLKKMYEQFKMDKKNYNSIEFVK